MNNSAAPNHATAQRQPRAPLLDWRAFSGAARPAGLVGVPSLPHQVLLTSGRSALFQALKLLQLPAGGRVAVSSYHCPTLVAPVLSAGCEPAFFALDAQGLPTLASLQALHGHMPLAAVIVSHHFGLARSLAALRQWCDEHQLPLVEDCAHTLWGPAGERPVGHWGDLATASLSKFLPLAEAGLLASTRPLAPLPLRRPGLRAELKACKDLWDRSRSARQRVLADTDAVTKAGARAEAAPAAPLTMVQAMALSDMARIAQAPPLATRSLWRMLPWGAAAQRRREHWALLRHELGGGRLPAVAARPLCDEPCGEAVPYVFPLWVREPQPLYDTLRLQGHAVLRWDRVWPGAPTAAAAPVDTGLAWREQVLQLLVHQSLRADELRATAAAIQAACAVSGR